MIKLSDLTLTVAEKPGSTNHDKKVRSTWHQR